MEEPKRPRGRPATGRKRDIKMTIQVTKEERQKIKEAAERQNMTVADWIISKL